MNDSSVWWALLPWMACQRSTTTTKMMIQNIRDRNVGFKTPNLSWLLASVALGEGSFEGVVYPPRTGRNSFRRRLIPWPRSHIVHFGDPGARGSLGAGRLWKPKWFCDGYTWHPGDFTVDDLERQAIPLPARNAPVDEKLLELVPSALA